MQTTTDAAEPTQDRSRPSLAGLPRGTACFYLVLFALAFIAYSLLWHDAPYNSGDAAGYQRAAQVLTGQRSPELLDRVPGYPLLLVLTGSSSSPTRALFYVSMLLHFGGIWMLGVALNATGIGERALRALGYCYPCLP